MIKTVEQFIDLLDRNNFSIEDFCKNFMGVDWNYEAKSFGELGLHGLDIVEMIMEIEKVLDCQIYDNCVEMIELMNPNDLTKRIRRNKKLNDLGI
jgi:acyl carrier protein